VLLEHAAAGITKNESALRTLKAAEQSASGGYLGLFLAAKGEWLGTNQQWGFALRKQLLSAGKGHSYASRAAYLTQGPLER